MKKIAIKITILVIFSLCILTAVFLSACNSETNKASANSEEVLEIIRTNDVSGLVNYYIIKDTENGQEYIVFCNYKGGVAITPRLPKDTIRR